VEETSSRERSGERPRDPAGLYVFTLELARWASCLYALCGVYHWGQPVDVAIDYDRMRSYPGERRVIYNPPSFWNIRFSPGLVVAVAELSPAVLASALASLALEEEFLLSDPVLASLREARAEANRWLGELVNLLPSDFVVMHRFSVSEPEPGVFSIRRDSLYAGEQLVRVVRGDSVTVTPDNVFNTFYGFTEKLYEELEETLRLEAGKAGQDSG